jgi:hypothetical protein
MGQDEKIKETQGILSWAIVHLNRIIKSRVTEYKHENYQVQFLIKDDKPIVVIQIPEKWIKGTNSKENIIHDKP